MVRYYYLIPLILFLLLTPYLYIFFILFELLFFPFFFYLYTKKNNKISYINYFLYYFIGSTLLLLNIYILLLLGLLNNLFIYKYQSFLLSFFLLFSFLFKIPVIPLHKWLPLLHTLSPTNSSIILSSLILKLPIYAILKFINIKDGYNILLISFTLVYLLILLISILTLYNIKEIIAYSSILHMSLLFISLLSKNKNRSNTIYDFSWFNIKWFI